MNKVTIVKIDPYGKTGLAIPQMVKKFTDHLEQLGDVNNVTASQVLSRLWARDPGVLLLAAVDPNATVKGFISAVVSPDGAVLMTQPRLDEPTENDAAVEMIKQVEDWATSLGAKELTLVSRRVDPKWLKKHGFEIVRYIATREISDD